MKTDPRENSSSVGLFGGSFPVLSRRCEISPQDVEHRECTSPRQWFSRVRFSAVRGTHDDQHHLNADIAVFHLCFVDVLSVKQQPALCGNIQLCFQF